MSFDPLPEIKYSKSENRIRFTCAGIVFAITLGILFPIMGLLFASLFGYLSQILIFNFYPEIIVIVLTFIFSIGTAIYIAINTYQDSKDFIDYLNGR